jgi:hypothetical protein
MEPLAARPVVHGIILRDDTAPWRDLVEEISPEPANSRETERIYWHPMGRSVFVARRCVFLISIGASVGLVALGVLAGDPARVFANAIILCLSCIGIQ